MYSSLEPSGDDTEQDKMNQLLENNTEKSSDIPQYVIDEVEGNRPSELEVRMQLMGITPLTIAGFGVAAIMITLNTILGSGWLADLLGIDYSPHIQTETFGTPFVDGDDMKMTITTIKLNSAENLLK